MSLYGHPIMWIVGIICALWVIYDSWMVNRKLDTLMKIVWTVLAILFSILTAIIYYVIYYVLKK